MSLTTTHNTENWAEPRTNTKNKRNTNKQQDKYNTHNGHTHTTNIMANTTYNRERATPIKTQTNK